MPFNSRTKNATQFVGLVISALVAFSGLVLNYLNSALEIARLSRTGKEEGLKRDITNFKAALAAITLGSIALAILFAVIKTARKGLKHRAAIAKKLCFCCRKKGRTHGRGSGRDGGDVDSDVEGGGSRTGVRAVELGALSFNPLHARRGGGRQGRGPRDRGVAKSKGMLLLRFTRFHSEASPTSMMMMVMMMVQ